LMTSRVLNP